jgi:hypothetical protein
VVLHHGVEVGVFHRLHGGQPLLVIVSATRNRKFIPYLPICYPKSTYSITYFM